MGTELRDDGELLAIAGASRSGKTLFAADRTRSAERLIAWDVELQWPKLGRCNAARSRAELVALARDRRVTRIAYQAPPPPPREEGALYAQRWLAGEFDFFCRVAWQWLMRAPATIVVEETSDITSPGKAPPSWGMLIRRGLKYGGCLVAITQRPSESEKTAIGNASRIVTFRMSRESDELYMARELRCDQARVAALRPLHYLERDMRTGELVAGVVRIPRRRA